MSSQRAGRRTFLKSTITTAAGVAWASSRPGEAGASPGRSGGGLATETQETSPAPAKAPRIRFAAIGLNHGHINGQVEAVIARGRRAGLVLREGGGPRRRLRQAVPAGEARAPSEQEILEDSQVQLVVSAAIANERAPARHPGDAARQGLHVRQAGDDDARAARRGAQRPGGDPAHLLDPLQRAAREPGHGEGRRAGEGRGHRPGDPDDRPRAAPHEPEDPPGLVLRDGSATAASSATSRRTSSTSSCSSPARRGPRSWPRRSATCTTPSIPVSRTSAT